MSTPATTVKRVVMRQMPMTNAERMYVLDEAWNARDWDTFDSFHDQRRIVVYWPGRQDSPTRGGPDHRQESIRFCRAFPDNKVHRPYYILFGEGDLTCFVTHFTGTFTAPLEMPDGTVIQPTASRSTSSTQPPPAGGRTRSSRSTSSTTTALSSGRSASPEAR